MKLSDIQKLSRHFQYSPSAAAQQEVHEYLLSLGYDPAHLYQELEMSSELVDAHRDVSYSNARMNLHSHTFYELLFCRTSCGAEYLIGSDRYRVQRGDIIFVPPGVSHRPLLPEDMPEPYKRYVLWLSPRFMDRFAALFPGDISLPGNTGALLRTAGTKWDGLREDFRTAVEEAEEKTPGWEGIVTGSAITLLTRLGRALKERSAKVMTAEAPDLLEQVLSYVEDHLAERLSLAETAHCFYVSESTVSQLFRRKMGVSFYRCVTQRRLIAAKSLIAGGGTLEDAGRQVGFSDYSTFYRAFRKEYGISPVQYRKLLKSASSE